MTEIRKIVLPGELVEEKKGRRVGNGAFYEEDKVFSKVIGIPYITEYEIKVIPLSNVYIPEVGDKVVGVITQVETSGWLVDINSPYVAFLPVSEALSRFADSKVDLSRYFDVNDIILCKISRVTKNKTTQASMKSVGARKLYGGITIEINPSKIPRVIGKAGSMINMIKERTGCEIVAGQNGVVWIRGENKSVVVETFLTIEKESHTLGLTERVEKILGERSGKEVRKNDSK